MWLVGICYNVSILTLVISAYRAYWYSSVSILDFFSRLQGWRMKDVIAKASGNLVRSEHEFIPCWVCHDWVNSHSATFLITPVALNTVIKEEACVKSFSYWLNTSSAFFCVFFCFFSLHALEALCVSPPVLCRSLPSCNWRAWERWMDKTKLLWGRWAWGSGGSFHHRFGRFQPAIQQVYVQLVLLCGTTRPNYFSSGLIFMWLCSPGFACFPPYKS